MDFQKDFVKKMPLPELKSFFFMINHVENFKRVFLKTIFRNCDNDYKKNI